MTASVVTLQRYYLLVIPLYTYTTELVCQKKAVECDNFVLYQLLKGGLCELEQHVHVMYVCWITIGVY